MTCRLRPAALLLRLSPLPPPVFPTRHLLPSIQAPGPLSRERSGPAGRKRGSGSSSLSALASSAPSLPGRQWRCRAVLGSRRLPALAELTGWKLGANGMRSSGSWEPGSQPSERSPSQYSRRCPRAPRRDGGAYPSPPLPLHGGTRALPQVGMPRERPGGWRLAAASARHSGKTYPPG